MSAALTLESMVTFGTLESTTEMNEHYKGEVVYNGEGQRTPSPSRTVC